MASKPIDPKPVQMPSLGPLPDPFKDLMGGAGLPNPTSLMTINQQEVDDMFNPKPIDDGLIKPSAEAAKALQAAQQQGQAQAQAAAKARQQHLKLVEQRRRADEKRAAENARAAEKLRKEREKALKEKAKEQGGKLGAAPDGSFVLTNNINELLKSQEWNSVVSDKQRRDRAEEALAGYAEQLRAMGASDEQIANEVENGRNMLTAHTDAYARSMRNSNAPVIDTTIEFVAGAGKAVTSIVGGSLKLLGADQIGDDILLRNKSIQSFTDENVSNKGKLEKANYAYEADKYYREHNINPELDITDLKSTGASLKLAYQNGTLDSIVTEQLPNILAAVASGAGGAAAGGIFAAKYGSKLPTVAKVLTGNLKTGSRILDKVVLPNASGAGLGVGGYSTLATISDAGAGAWQEVRDTDFKTIKKVYGDEMWKKAVEIHGSEEAARNALADEAFNRAAKRIAPVAVATSFLGAEATIAGMFARQAVKDEAKKLTAKGVLKGAGGVALTALEEGLEEGYTQYASNVAANPYTGVNPDQGVAEAAGLGALVGGGTTAVANALSTFAKEAQGLPPPDYAQEFVKQGFFDDKQFRQHFERHMAWYEKQYQKDNDTTINDVQHYKQTHYNELVDKAYTISRDDGTTDTKSIWDIMTPEQEQNFKQYVRSSYGINTNNYAPHQDTAEYDAIKNSNMDVLSRPENEDLLNTWRVLNNTDVDQIPADRQAYYQALADTTAFLQPTENTHNTNQREQLFGEFRETDLQQRGLTENQIADIVGYARNILGANSRRFTDAEQQAWDTQQVTSQAQEQPNGTDEQNQTDNSQSSGQGPIDENAEPVAEESVRTDTSQATTLRQAAEELADAFSGRPASPDAQSVGNDNPRQGTDPSSQTNTPTENGAGVVEPNAGVGQAQSTGVTVNPTTPEIHSGASPQSEDIGQTNQGGQSFGPTVAPATQTTTGGGSVGTPPTKRNSNGRSKQTSAKNRAIELGKAGVEIDLEFIVVAYENPKNKLNKKGLIGKGITALVREQAGTSNPNAYQVLQHLTKLPDSQLTSTLLNFEYEDAKGNKRKLSQDGISSARANRYNLLLAVARAELKNQSTQSTTDTNADNGSQDVDEANFADTADENPQAAVEQPVQTADDVETIEQAEELVDDIAAFLLDTYPDLDVNEVLGSIYEHYDALNDYFINIPNANDQLADLFLHTAKAIEDKARYDRYTNAIQNAAAAAELVGDDFNMVFDNTIASADPAVTNNIEKRISRLEQYTELALDDTQNQQQENDRINDIREFNDEVERHNRELDEAIRNTGIEVPRIVLRTSPADITKALAALVTPPSQRGKSKRARLSSTKRKITPQNGKGNKQKLSPIIGDPRESVIITGAYDAPKTGWLENTSTGIVFIPDDGSVETLLPRPKPRDTFQTWNREAGGITLDYSYLPAYDDEFYTRGDDFELNEVTAKQEAANERAAKKAIYDQQRQSRVDETSTSEQIASDNRREKVISQDENGRWRMQVANNRLPALRADTTATQDRAGASRPTGDTQTSASQAEQVGTDSANSAVADTSYQMGHTAPIDLDEDSPLYELDRNSFPSDVYSDKGISSYGSGYDTADRLAFDIINRVRGNPNADVVIYRAVQSSIPTDTINEGDWVTLTREYANEHGNNALRGNYKVLTKTVKAADLYTDGNSIQEWGYTTRHSDNTQEQTNETQNEPRESQAEPVKPKWSGRSKKKTTPQLETDSKQNNTGVENFTDKQMNALYSFAKEIGLKGQLKKSGKFIPARAEEALSNLRELATTKPRYFNTLINLVGLKAGRLGVEYTQILRDLSQLTQQEQSNAEENDLGQSVQPTQEQTTDENQTDTVGTDNTSDIGRREVPRQSAEQVGEQSQTSGTKTTQNTNELGIDTPTQFEGTPQLLTGTIDDKVVGTTFKNIRGVNKAAILSLIDGTNSSSKLANLLTSEQSNLTQEQAQALVQFASAVPSGEFNQSYADYLITNSNAEQQTTQKAKTGREPIQDYLKNNPREHDTIRSYFNEQRALAGTVYDNAVAANNVTNEITSNYNLFNGSEIDFIEKMLGDRPFTDENIAQVVADTRTVYTAGITFDSLPTPVQDIIRKIWDKIKSTVAAISMALAVTTGTTLAIPTEANAATLTETAVVQNIVSQNDNQGKQFIVADKQAGTLTVYTPLGQQITSTPALFGKATGDSISTNNATPSGRYDMNFTDGANIDGKGYGSSAQALSVNGRLQENNAGNVAIHRVLPIENRQGRLDSATATDNRISHGCINVPSSFYDIHLDRKQDTVVYVMPETDAGRTGVFNVLGTSDLSRSENSVPTATQTTTDTKEQVDPAYDNANSQSVEVTPEQLSNATPHDQVKVAPKPVPTPLTVKGAEQSTQVVYTTPTVLGGANGTAPITADRIVLPKIDGKVVHTPAEQRADTSFDTEPVKDKTDDGISLAEVAVGLAAAFGGGMYVSRRRRRAKAKKLESKKRTPVADNPPPTDSTPTPDPTPNMPQDPPTTEQVQDTVNAEHNEQVNKSANNAKSIPTDIKAPPQPTAVALAVNREMWLKYLVETNQLGETGSQEMADLLLNALRGFEYSNRAVMTDKSYQQANDGTFKNHRHWGDGEVNTDRVGVFNKLINIAAGATPIFDNLMGKLGIARGGHEADSSLASIALSQVKSKAQGAYAQIHKFFVNPMLERSKLLAQELRRGDGEIKLATGRVATANHILNEAADAMWKGFEAELAHRQDSLDKVNADLAANPSNKDYPLRMMNTAKQLENEIRQVSELYTRTRNMYEGKTAWDGETKLPGGMTKARAEQDIAEVKAEYGADYAKIEKNAKELTKSIRGIRQFATAAGVFTNDDIEVFNELGFDEYVPLYSEEKDPTDVNEEDNYTQSSIMDRLLQGIPLMQARSMGLTKDLSRYRRKGAKSPAADGFTNMEKFAMNMAGRVGQQNWVEMNQQLYEGTVGKPYSAANITDPDTLADLNASYDSGKVPGLIRVRPGMKNFLPSDVQAKIDKVRPIMGKGRNANGDTVAFEYYWTEPAIQVEIYANTDLSNTLTADYLRNIGTATRAAARLVTVGKPVWNLYNFVRDSFERVSVMLMRPVKDQSGNLVPKWKLATAFFRALPTVVLNAKDIYRYLVLGEVKTPLQAMLNEAVGEGSINLMTTQTEKHSVISDLKKSRLEKAGNKISKWLGDTANKTGAGGARNAMTKGFDFYIAALSEVPQVSTALASYMAYQNVGVNKKESANRVRDAYDPNRTNNEFIHNLGQFHPFVRSTFSGHYNLARSLTQYWKPGEWQFTLAYTLGGTLGVIGMLTMLAGAFDDDDDGRSALARLPLSTLMGGAPVPWGENGVWTLPVGFGMNKFIWGIGANFYRYLNGYQNANETAMGLVGLLVDNTSPVQATGGSNLSENPTAAAVLTVMPMLLKPIVEMGFNTKAYGGGKIYGKDTPRDQLNSQQDNFNTPETYKKWASWLNENGFGDFRPETLRHLFESYSNLAGPFTAIPQAVIADQSEKTLGNKERKGEVFGATLTALGAGMSIQPNALDIANLTYEMDDRRYELHRKYGVGESHPDEIYEQYAQRGERGGILKDAKYVTEVRLREKGVPEEHIKYIINGMAYQSKREKLDKKFKDLALEYNRLVASGKEDLQMRQSVQNAWDALEKLTNDYVKDNNDVFFTLRK